MNNGYSLCDSHRYMSMHPQKIPNQCITIKFIRQHSSAVYVGMVVVFTIL